MKLDLKPPSLSEVLGLRLSPVYSTIGHVQGLKLVLYKNAAHGRQANVTLVAEASTPLERLSIKMSLTYHLVNDYSTPLDRSFDDVFSPHTYRQVQQSDVFRQR